jgi:molybdopterin-containing oxidoreductase family membrane subunit
MTRDLSLNDIQSSVLEPLVKTSAVYKVILILLFGGIGLGYFCWVYQIRLGMGVTGISHPVGWGTYIGSFVFWIGIAHSGTLISAILFLLRAKWRTAVSRAAEAMTIFAIMTAGLFPLIHLGRFWVFYFILPYPSQRQVWPNFQSPLVLDLVAIFTYLTVSVIFFYAGLIPDLAKARDAYSADKSSWRYKLYNVLSLGWQGKNEQWLHHGRGYLYFAALATPLVVSVHSVVSWDFAAGILPGWHSTIFAPYFVAGAIHSGLAMVLTLLIPMRKLFHLEKLIKIRDFELAAQTMILTTLIIAYAYAIEPFIAWMSGDTIERQFSNWRFTGELFWMYPVLLIGNVLLPILFVFKKIRTNLYSLFFISLCVNFGMWIERLWIVISATMHDFMPHNWGHYFPTWVELSILLGSFSLFFFLFLSFSKLFPTIAISDVQKEQIQENIHEENKQPEYKKAEKMRGVVGVYGNAESFINGLKKLKEQNFGGIETFTPAKIEEVESVLGKSKSGIRYFTLAGAIGGLTGGFALAILTALSFKLIVGGKHPVSIVPYCIVGFEGTILIGSLANFIAMILFARLGRLRLHPAYDGSFSRNKFGVFVECDLQKQTALEKIMTENGAEEVKGVGFE